MVVQEESGGDVERYEDVDRVVFMGSQDEEDAKQVQDPGQSMNKVPAPWSVFGDKEVQHGYDYGVAAEHVVAASMDSSETHPETSPDGYGSL